MIIYIRVPDFRQGHRVDVVWRCKQEVNSGGGRDTTVLRPLEGTFGGVRWTSVEWRAVEN